MSCEAQYLAGFLDGDGTVFLPTPKFANSQPNPVVGAKQSYNRGVPPELAFVQSSIGGSICISAKATETVRTSWRFQTNVFTVEAGLSMISNHGVIKKYQADLALEYLAGKKAKPIEYAQKLRDAKKDVGLIKIDSDRLTLPYVAGLFAAEGSVGLHRNQRGGYNLVSSIKQSSCPRVLHAIKEKLGYGRVYGDAIRFTKKATSKFLKSIQPFIKKSQKRRQIKLVQKYLASFGARCTDKEKKKIDRIAEKLVKLKNR